MMTIMIKDTTQINAGSRRKNALEMLNNINKDGIKERQNERKKNNDSYYSQLFTIRKMVSFIQRTKTGRDETKGMLLSQLH